MVSCTTIIIQNPSPGSNFNIGDWIRQPTAFEGCAQVKAVTATHYTLCKPGLFGPACFDIPRDQIDGLAILCSSSEIPGNVGGMSYATIALIGAGILGAVYVLTRKGPSPPVIITRR